MCFSSNVTKPIVVLFFILASAEFSVAQSAADCPKEINKVLVYYGGYIHQTDIDDDLSTIEHVATVSVDGTVSYFTDENEPISNPHFGKSVPEAFDLIKPISNPGHDQRVYVYDNHQVFFRPDYIGPSAVFLQFNCKNGKKMLWLAKYLDFNRDLFSLPVETGEPIVKSSKNKNATDFFNDDFEAIPVEAAVLADFDANYFGLLPVGAFD